MLKHTKLLQEARRTDSNDFYELMGRLYGTDSPLIGWSQMSEQMVESASGKRFETYRSDDGNLVIRYLDNDDEIIISGFLSERGKIVRGNLKDIQGWMGDLLERMKEGATVIASLNKYSKPIMQRLLKDLEESGKRVRQDSFNVVEYGTDSWETLAMKVVG